MKYEISNIYAPKDNICDSGLASQSVLIGLKPQNRRRADTTPIKAPPALKPLAISVPVSPRSLFTELSVERVVTSQFIAPPTSNGALSSIGINIPKAKAKAGMRKKFNIRAMMAPVQ